MLLERDYNNLAQYSSFKGYFLRKADREKNFISDKVRLSIVKSNTLVIFRM